VKRHSSCPCKARLDSGLRTETCGRFALAFTVPAPDGSSVPRVLNLQAHYTKGTPLARMPESVALSFHFTASLEKRLPFPSRYWCTIDRGRSSGPIEEDPPFFPPPILGGRYF